MSSLLSFLFRSLSPRGHAIPAEGLGRRKLLSAVVPATNAFLGDVEPRRHECCTVSVEQHTTHTTSSSAIAEYHLHLELIGKRVVDLILLVLIELFSVSVTVESLRTKID